MWTLSKSQSRKTVPVPDQKGEEEGGTKLQPTGETTEEPWSEQWEGDEAVVGAEEESGGGERERE